MLDLGTGVDLEPAVKELQGSARLVALLSAQPLQRALVGVREQRGRRGHVQQLEHFSAQVRGVCAARDPELDPRGAEPVQHRGHVVVEREGLADLVGTCVVCRVGLEGRVDVRIDPEGPERVVEVEHDEARERLAVCQDGGQRGRDR